MFHQRTLADRFQVVNGTVGYSSALQDGQTLTAMNGANLTINIDNGNVFVNSAKVITPNVLVANGVVHVIDVSTPFSVPLTPPLRLSFAPPSQLLSDIAPKPTNSTLERPQPLRHIRDSRPSRLNSAPGLLWRVKHLRPPTYVWCANSDVYDRYGTHSCGWLDFGVCSSACGDFWSGGADTDGRDGRRCTVCRGRSHVEHVGLTERWSVCLSAMSEKKMI